MFEGRVYVKDLENYEGKKIVLAGWVHDIRLLGGINFIILRDGTGKTQVVIRDKENVENLHQEDVIKVEGKVKKSISKQFPFEVEAEKLEVISKAEVSLPLDPREITKTNLDTKLDWRFMYFRTEEAVAIFRIQTEIVRAFRDFFLSRGFIEMQPPIIIASASEGGAELFSLPYFEKKVYLAQSPQLYKQMGAVSFEKVFMIMPVFRAERFDQPTHLNEIRQMDIEVAFADEEDAMKLLEECFIYILSQVRSNCSKELAYLGEKINIPRRPLPRIPYEKAVKELQKRGENIKIGDDFSKMQEKMLEEIFGEAFFLIDWPSELKPFYTMPKESNPRIVKAFDLIYKGLEISSGSQRIHVPALLEQRIKEKGLDPKDFEYYINSFRYGAPPHSGWSIGLERLTMKICGKTNIKEVTMFPRTRTRILP